MPPRGARILFVDFPVSDPVESHGRSSRRHHRQENQNDYPQAGEPSRCNNHRPGGKGQSEDSVRKTNEFEDPLDELCHKALRWNSTTLSTIPYCCASGADIQKSRSESF